jgi:transketolase
MSAADLMAVLLANHLRYDFDDPANPDNDHLIFSKGHASPLYYALLKAAGAISDDELLTFRKFGSRLEGHPTPALPYVDVATGSLGQGLPVAVGIALSGKLLERRDYRVWVLCGDSELAEGSVWEAFDHASYAGLDNLTAILDINRLGQRGETMHGWDLDLYARRASSFGWEPIVIDGHDVEAVDEAFAQARRTSGKPVAIIAKTRKGRGVAAVEDQNGAHGKPLPDAEEAIRELGGERDVSVSIAKPTRAEAPSEAGGGSFSPPRYELGKEVATRKAYGEALVALGAARPDVVALDGEVSNSTYAELFCEAYPERYFEMFIAEQQMVAAAVGLQRRGWVPFASTFAAFLTRAYDFIRMAAVSRANIRLMGSHAGVEIGEDGPSQMGLEDLAMFRAIHGSTVVYPSDPNQTADLVRQLADRPGISYLRTTRGARPAIYAPGEQFPVGSSRLLRSSADDVATVIAAGVTVHEALAAADELAAQGLPVRVLDLYSVKPIDSEAIEEAAASTGAIVTVEDHWPEGGLGDAVLAALAAAGTLVPTAKLAVREMPGSGTSSELLAAAGIDARAIAAAVRDVAAMEVTASSAE